MNSLLGARPDHKRHRAPAHRHADEVRPAGRLRTSTDQPQSRGGRVDPGSRRSGTRPVWRLSSQIGTRMRDPMCNLTLGGDPRPCVRAGRRMVLESQPRWRLLRVPEWLSEAHLGGIRTPAPAVLRSPTPPSATATAAGSRVSRHSPRSVTQIAMTTSARVPTEPCTLLSTGSAWGARVRSVHSPSPAKNRK